MRVFKEEWKMWQQPYWFCRYGFPITNMPKFIDIYQDVDPTMISWAWEHNDRQDFCFSRPSYVDDPREGGCDT